MSRKASFASKHGGRAPPWRARALDLVVPLPLARSIRREVRRLRTRAEAHFSIRGYGTIVVWRDGVPIGSVTLVQNTPQFGSATIRRIEWDELHGYAEDDVWRAIELLAGGPLVG